MGKLQVTQHTLQLFVGRLHLFQDGNEGSTMMNNLRCHLKQAVKTIILVSTNDTLHCSMYLAVGLPPILDAQVVSTGAKCI